MVPAIHLFRSALFVAIAFLVGTAANAQPSAKSPKDQAGAGVKGGMTYGRTDELGLSVAENPVSVHDLHATILHLLGFDHQQLTYRYSGRDFRLTDVHEEVLRDILA